MPADAGLLRFAPGAFGPGTPGDGLLVSPLQRVAMTGAGNEALFNCPEVLVSAMDLDPDGRARRAGARTAGTLHLIMLDQAHVVWANGLACESFHPDDADLAGLPDADRLALIEAAPEAYRDAEAFGPHARRCLTPAEVVLAGFTRAGEH